MYPSVHCCFLRMLYLWNTNLLVCYYIVELYAVKLNLYCIAQQAFIDIRLHPGITTTLMAIAAQCSLHVSASRPLRPNVTSSIKPEVHNVSQRRLRRTKQTKFREDRSSSSRDMLVDRQTNTQTGRQTSWSQYSALLPGRSKYTALFWQQIFKVISCFWWFNGASDGYSTSLMSVWYFAVCEDSECMTGSWGACKSRQVGSAAYTKTHPNTVD